MSASYSEVLADHEGNLSSSKESIMHWSFLLLQPRSRNPGRYRPGLTQSSHPASSSSGNRALGHNVTTQDRQLSRPSELLCSITLPSRVIWNRHKLRFGISSSNTRTWKVQGIYRNAVPRSQVFDDQPNNFDNKLLRRLEDSRLTTSLRISVWGSCP